MKSPLEIEWEQAKCTGKLPKNKNAFFDRLVSLDDTCTVIAIYNVYPDAQDLIVETELGQKLKNIKEIFAGMLLLKVVLYVDNPQDYTEYLARLPKGQQLSRKDYSSLKDFTNLAVPMGLSKIASKHILLDVEITYTIMELLEIKSIDVSWNAIAPGKSDWKKALADIISAQLKTMKGYASLDAINSQSTLENMIRAAVYTKFDIMQFVNGESVPADLVKLREYGWNEDVQLVNLHVIYGVAGRRLDPEGLTSWDVYGTAIFSLKRINDLKIDAKPTENNQPLLNHNSKRNRQSIPERVSEVYENFLSEWNNAHLKLNTGKDTALQKAAIKICLQHLGAQRRSKTAD
ncbi:hypothetical protein Ddc_17286 [Ditylenchus destructor]|nr:hypothetical protein Ddc_17286 [Ditylenchus destructor]